VDAWTKGDADKLGLPLEAGYLRRSRLRMDAVRGGPSHRETFDIVGAGDGLTGGLTSPSLDGRACGAVGGTFKCNAGSFFGIFSLSVVPGMLADRMNPEDLALSVTVTQVPEPSTWAMMLAGFAGLGFLSYRASRKIKAAV
jgi:hypothetical protein